MTREEAINTLKKVLDHYYDDLRGCPDYQYIGEALHTLKSEIFSMPFLPSNLDEAAESIASNIAPTHPDIGWDECFEKIVEGIKAGAEWMAGQGYTFESRIYRDQNPPKEGLFFGVLPFFTTMEMALNIQDGDEVIVKIRKK